jgi:hypothetical protein
LDEDSDETCEKEEETNLGTSTVTKVT